ncbi:uncharacterized protein LOC127289300 [Leptopilina boulardi]|uniref:uncharacterized protein LOC127289300 n=1 Tax=Leptopilina boulardi TaxID=63433 RepID=UPI0021F54A3C|nr:uncharacterized protein LOC127289300 [Leptopilina boulardi]
MQLLYPVKHFLNIQNYYYCIVAMTYFGTLAIITAYVAFDTVLVIFIQHACGMFSLNLNNYNSNWYNISLRTKKMLYIMLLKSEKVCKLTGGKFFDMSYHTFVKVGTVIVASKEGDIVVVLEASLNIFIDIIVLSNIILWLFNFTKKKEQFWRNMQIKVERSL